MVYIFRYDYINKYGDINSPVIFLSEEIMYFLYI